MDALRQIAQSPYAWLYALVALLTCAGAGVTAWAAYRHGLGKWLAMLVGLAICGLQLLTFQIVKPRLLAAILSSAMGAGELIVGIALLLASAPIAIPIAVILTMRLLSRAKQRDM